MNFLKNIWATGLVNFIAIPNENGGWRHFSVKENVAEIVEGLVKAGKDAYFACSNFKEERVYNEKLKKYQSRTQKNVASVKAFWFDIDVSKEERKQKVAYQTKQEAIEALKLFCKTAKFPKPTTVDSGYGIHVYWIMDESVEPEKWQKRARNLAALAQKIGLKVDPARTQDSASVLRIPGTRNFKRGGNVPVKMLLEGDIVSKDKMFKAIKDAVEQNGVIEPQFPKESSLIFKQFSTNLFEQKPVSGDLVVEKCAQMAEIYSKKGAVAEPFRYKALQLARFFENREEWFVKLTEGHHSFGEGKTEIKVAQLDDKDVGPTLCESFDRVNPNVCSGCEYTGLCVSPVVLGKEVKQAEAPQIAVEVEEQKDVEDFILPQPPKPYLRGDDGAIYLIQTEEDSKVPVQIYENDVYPYSMVMDKYYESQIFHFRVKLPRDGWREFTVSAADMYDRKTVLKRLGDAGIILINSWQQDEFIKYILSYCREIQKMNISQIDHAQMGWVDHGSGPSSFVLGDRQYYKSGAPRAAGISSAIKTATAAIKNKGTKEGWKQAAELLNADGYEAHQFGVLASFAAPIFKFSGYMGAIVNMVGQSGTGKSTVLKIGNAIYGHPTDMMLGLNDTQNAMYARMGAYNNLPISFDEITNIESHRLSSLCYDVTQGRGKHRLKSDATERDNHASWETMMISTSNSSLLNKLSIAKADASAESMRVFEFDVPSVEGITRGQAKDIFGNLDKNCGEVGHEYIKAVVRRQSEVKTLVETKIAEFEEAIDATSRERFWTAVVGTVIAAGTLAKELGMIDYDLNKIASWAAKKISLLRSDVNEIKGDATDILIGFLNSRISNTVVVNKTGSAYTMTLAPKGELSIRIEREGKVEQAFIAKSAFRTYCAEINAEYNDHRRKLKDIGVISKSDVNKMLGAHTEYKTGVVSTLVVNLRHPLIEGILEPGIELKSNIINLKAS